MANKIAIYEGYGSGPFAGYGRRRKRRSRRGGGAQRNRMRTCAKKCKGRAGFKSCMRVCLRK